MAADLSGMFAQMNNAIKAQPLPSGVPLDVFSRGAGNLAGTLSGGAIDNYSMMTPEARQAQGRSELGQIKNMSSSGGLEQASSIYNKMGKTEKSIQYGNQARQAAEAEKELADEQLALAEHEQLKIDTADIAFGRGEQEIGEAILKGAMDPQEYMSKTFESKLRMTEAEAAKDPSRGAFTETVIQTNPTTGQQEEVKIRYNRLGQGVAILGEGRESWDIVQLFNPDTNSMQSAQVDKLNPQNHRFIGTSKKPETKFELLQVGNEFVVMATPPGGAPVEHSRMPTQSEGQQQLAVAKKQVAAANMIGSIDQAINLIDTTGVGGVSALLAYVPTGNAERTYSNLITSVKANVGFDQLLAMRAQGGTLGQVSNIENKLLQSTIATLDPLADPDVTRANLNKIRAITERLAAVQGMDESEAARTLFTAETDKQGMPTRNKIYTVDENTLIIITPEGKLTTKFADGTEMDLDTKIYVKPNKEAE